PTLIYPLSLHDALPISILVNKMLTLFSGKRTILVLSIAGIAIFSQNLVPVHIAFIPILILPLLGLFNKLQIDRRAVASALTFGLDRKSTRLNSSHVSIS